MPFASADTVWVKSETTGKPLMYSSVKVEKIAKGDSAEDLFYTLSNGQARNKPLDLIVQIKADDDPTFSSAEEAFAAGDMKAAAAGYRKSLNSPKPWIKRRSDLRLVQAAGKSGDFGDMVTAFVLMSQKSADAAAKIKPQVNAAAPAELDAAITSVRNAVANANPDQKQVLLPFLVELYNAKKDTKSAEQTMLELTKLNPAAANTAEAKQARADLALAAARDALAKKDYAQAQTQIESNAALFTEPPQQDEALFTLAECKSATASNDTELKDAALAYMRVVANFKLLSGAPHIAESLFKTAEIEEKLKDNKTAALLYGQVSADFKDSPLAQTARERAEKLK